MRRKSSGLCALLGVDKPVGCTSHDVVGRLRRQLGESRIGHAGTLDPLASGVMVVGVGQATRLMQFATAQTKAYSVRIAFGRATETDDAEGRTVLEAAPPALVLDASWANEQMGLLLGMTEQVPPAYSAVHVDGARAYERARNGCDVQLAPRPIRVVDARLVGVGQEGGEPWWDVDVVVSKGTYVRSLARDLGALLGSAAYVGALRRTASGPVTISDCLPPEQFGAQWDRSQGILDPLAVLGIPGISISSDDVVAIVQGKRLSVGRVDGGRAREFDDDARVALVYDTQLYALARKTGSALVASPVFADGVAGVGSPLP